MTPGTGTGSAFSSTTQMVVVNEEELASEVFFFLLEIFCLEPAKYEPPQRVRPALFDGDPLKITSEDPEEDNAASPNIGGLREEECEVCEVCKVCKVCEICEEGEEGDAADEEKDNDEAGGGDGRSTVGVEGAREMSCGVPEKEGVEGALLKLPALELLLAGLAAWKELTVAEKTAAGSEAEAGGGSE